MWAFSFVHVKALSGHMGPMLLSLVGYFSEFRVEGNRFEHLMSGAVGFEAYVC